MMLTISATNKDDSNESPILNIKKNKKVFNWEWYWC